jgi:hypothetical protein
MWGGNVDSIAEISSSQFLSLIRTKLPDPETIDLENFPCNSKS